MEQEEVDYGTEEDNDELKDSGKGLRCIALYPARKGRASRVSTWNWLIKVMFSQECQHLKTSMAICSQKEALGKAFCFCRWRR